MDEHEVRRLFAGMFTNLSAEAEYELRDPEYVLEMPQSGERIRGRDTMRAMQEAYPAPPTDMRLRRVTGSGDTWFVEGVADWSGRVHYLAVIVEFRDGKIVRDTRYYAEPFEAPAWRTPFVERMESDPS